MRARYAGLLLWPVVALAGPEVVPLVSVEPVAPGSRVVAAVELNAVDRGERVLLRGAGNYGWCLTEADLKDWSLRLQRLPVEFFQGLRYRCLGELSGYVENFDPAQQRLALSVAPENFLRQVYDSRLQPPVPRPQTGYGAFLNYDVLGTRQPLPGSTDTPWQIGAFAESVVFTPWGSLESQFIGRNRAGSDASVQGSARDFARLDTFWRMDLPERMATLTLGDAIGSSGYWGRPTRFAGLRYATNFDTRPGFVVRPQLAFAGEAQLPSVVEVFVNQARVERFEVGSGPFELNELPTFGNAGEAQVVITDVLGRQTVTTLPFLTSQQQLRAGLSRYAVELGVQREATGFAGDRYGEALAMLQGAYGISDHITGELRLELSESLRAGGVGASFSEPWLGVLSPVVAYSDSDAGTGVLTALTLERPTVAGVYASASLQQTTRDFRQLGLPLSQLPPQRLIAATLGRRFGPVSASLGHVRQSLHDGPEVRVINGGMASSIQGTLVSLNVADRQTAGVRSQSYFLSLNRSFGARLRGSGGLRVRDGEQQDRVELRSQLQRSLPDGPGYGWRVLAGTERLTVQDPLPGTPEPEWTPRAEAAAQVNARYARATAQVARANDVTGSRLGVSGAMGMAGVSGFISRPITRSFGVVDAPALAGLDVRVNGQRVGVLDDQGYLLLPQLVPFAPNRVQVSLDAVPLDIHITDAAVDVVPGNRTGHRVVFAAERRYGALLRLLQTNGRPVPLGAEIEVLGETERYLVADQGDAYVASVHTSIDLRVRWNGQSCSLSLSWTPTGDRPAPLGPQLCRSQP